MFAGSCFQKSRRVHQLVRKLQEWESLLNVFRIHVEMPRGGELSKTCAPEPPAGRFPKFLLPRAAGRTQKLKTQLSLPSPTPVRVVGGEWKSGGSRWNQDFPDLHMAASQAWVCQSATGTPQISFNFQKSHLTKPKLLTLSWHKVVQITINSL